MKTYKYLLLLGAFPLLTACNDLDTAPMGSTLTSDQREQVIANQPEKLDATVSGIYGNFFAWKNIMDEFYDFGVPSIITMLNQMGVSLSCPTYDYGWYSSCGMLDMPATSDYTRLIWSTYYNTIYSANQVMDVVDPKTDDETLKYYMAQALGARAYSYWMLAQLWQFNYAVNPDAPCVPLITEKNAEDAALNGTPRATVKEVYTQILADLDEAIAFLDGNSISRPDGRYVDIAVLYGLRARANLCMQNYKDAYSDAMSAIAATSARPLTAQECSVPGFNNINNPDWMWGIIINEVNANGLYTFSGFMGSFSYGYAYAGQWQLISSKLFDAIPAGDVRKGWWINPDGYTSIADNYSATYEGLTASQYLQYGVEAPEYAVVKFAPYQDQLLQTLGATDVPLMRVEEMYLIAAEAKAMTNAGEGKALLEQFVNQYRWTDSSAPYVCSAASSEGVRDEILRQRQIELWGEGFDYIDLMRLNKGLDRKNSNFNPSWAFNIAPKSPVLILPIPQSEIEGNPKISAADQNPAGQVFR